MYAELGRRDRSRLTPATLRRINATLSSALTTAVRRGLIERNPTATVELPRPHRARPTAWTAEEFSTFLRATQHDRLWLLFLMLGLLGLRRGEALALRWSEVDLVEQRLRVERSTVKVARQLVTGPPKSERGGRTLALDTRLCGWLAEHMTTQEQEARQNSASPPASERARPTLVFTTPTGTQLDPAYVSRRFDSLQRSMDVPRIRLHDLRHTSASIGLSSGETLLEVSRRLGHSSITITADVYSHISPTTAQHSATRLARCVLTDGLGGQA
ncbi:site-specific integrase [Nocardioides zeae]|uniref:Site-specific integrase n=1 Tax=Nocardioides imazamoxiresistens TaxID=3231893 RepID=A0ABU3PQT5_9ACTN|nr:site-specific integrase [Nocardioides zeae]MDT9591588.1 site-specific integrase [Nocardioides zeae]